MNKLDYETQYRALCEEILAEGELVSDRTNTGTISKFALSMKHDLSKSFPLLTSKKVNLPLIAGELLWFLSGSTDLVSLRKYQNKKEGDHTIWSDDFKKYHEVHSDKSTESCGGNIYGKQLRSYEDKVDQFTTLLSNIEACKLVPSHPSARRLRCSFWNPVDHLEDKVTCALPACHTDFQFLLRGDTLNLHFNMRSNDIFLGNPYNTASYALLVHIVAQLTNLKVGTLSYLGVDTHIYTNHLKQVRELLSNEPTSPPQIIMPEFETVEDLLNLTGNDFKLKGYNPHKFIPAPQAS